MTQGSRGRRRAWIAAAALVVIIAAAWAIRGVGQWLVVQDALEPAQAIVVLSGRMPVRAREAAEIYREGGSKVIVVTTKPHTRRVKAIWKRLVGNSPRLMVRYASQDGYDGVHWWRRTSDALDVVRELLGLANAWAGFPVQPEKR